MKKKNLAILLIIPFLIAIFGVVTIQVAFNLIDNDVIRINWNYHDNELFEVGKQFTLEAEGVVADKRYPASAGNRLEWEVENADGAEEAHAEVFTDGHDNWFLKTLSVGSVTISCSTEKGNVTPMRMTGVIYTGDAFVINPTVSGSGQNVDPMIYYGEYDLKDGVKQPATFSFMVMCSDESLRSGITVNTERTSQNVTVDLVDGTVKIKGAGAGITTVALENKEFLLSTEYTFRVVQGGVNVYTYEDILACTNRSENGEVMVLRKNFESKANVEGSKANNVALFGTARGNGFNFAEEVYRFPTTFNNEYIKQWNAYAQNTSYGPVDDEIVAGLRVQKSVYGNGYTLNLHNLCFPTQYTSQTDSTTGASYDYYFPGNGDLFRGPKPFYTLGDPTKSNPLISAFGQDNVGVYVDGNNVTVNDVKIKNCDFGLIVANLTYAGTVLEVHGNNNTVKNSVLSNGKNVMRSFSSMNLTVENCILSTSRNFLLEVGSNRYEKTAVDDSTKHTFTKLDGSTYSATIGEHVGAGGDGDTSLGLFTTGLDLASLGDIMGGEGGGEPIEYTKDQMKAALHSLQKGLNREDTVTADDIDGSTEIRDVIFYRSGIAAIGVETLFNGPFLYNRAPSLLNLLLGALGGMQNLMPGFSDLEMNLSGASYPVSVNLSGNTRFFDYKSVAEWDIEGLIEQHISDVVSGLGLGANFNITIDDIFPLKSILERRADANKVTYYAQDGTKYINIPVAFYGGGRNLSTVTLDGLTAGGLTDAIDVDLLDSYLDLNEKLDIQALIDAILGSGDPNLSALPPNFMTYMRQVLTKTVTVVTGYEPFKFRFGNDHTGVFDTETDTPLIPNYRDLIKA